jgi:hypothetical protein
MTQAFRSMVIHQRTCTNGHGDVFFCMEHGDVFFCMEHGDVFFCMEHGDVFFCMEHGDVFFWYAPYLTESARPRKSG